MWLNQVSNPGPLAHESDVLKTALRGPEIGPAKMNYHEIKLCENCS